MSEDCPNLVGVNWTFPFSSARVKHAGCPTTCCSARKEFNQTIKKGRKPKLRKSVLAVMAAGSVFALTAAGAAVLTVSGGQNFNVSRAGTVSITVKSCDGTVTPSFVAMSGASSDYIDKVVLSATGTTCQGLTGKVSYDAADKGTATFSATNPSLATIDVADFKPATSPFDVDITVE